MSSKLYTLLDLMRQFNGKEFFELIGLLQVFISGYKLSPGSMKEEGLIEVLGRLEGLCSSSWFISSVAQIQRIKNTVLKYSHDPKSVHDSLMNLYTRLNDDIATIVLMQLEPNKLKYYEAIDLFGEDVSSSFPTAEPDIREAGNCFVTGRYTACVFHLMRVLEKGLFSLAKAVKIKTLKEFQYENWHNIIEQIESKIKDAEKLPRGPKKTEKLKKLGDAAKELRHFKNAWRNHVMHSRISYGESEAEKILMHVGEFMRVLAK